MADETNGSGVGEREHSHPTGGAWNVTRWVVPGCPACSPATPAADDASERKAKSHVLATRSVGTATVALDDIQAASTDASGADVIEALEANVVISALMAGRISGPQAVAAINGRATGIVSAAATRARAEERERIAQAIDRERFHMSDCVCVVCAAYRRAARIARGDA